jgi:hypothetical protein
MKKIIGLITLAAILCGCTKGNGEENYDTTIKPLIEPYQKKLKYIESMAMKCWASHTILKNYRFERIKYSSPYNDTMLPATQILLKPNISNKLQNEPDDYDHFIVDGYYQKFKKEEDKSKKVSKSKQSELFIMYFLSARKDHLSLLGRLADPNNKHGKIVIPDITYWSKGGEGCNR